MNHSSESLVPASESRRLLSRHALDAAPGQRQSLERALRQAVAAQQELSKRCDTIHRVVDLLVDGDGFRVLEEPSNAPSLETLLKDAPLDARTVARYGVQICDALIFGCYPAAAPHRPHGAIRSAAIFVVPPRVRVADFGIAQAYSQTIEEGAAIIELDRLSPYTPREIFQNPGQYGELRDLFAVGVVLFELATGVHPFGADRDDPNDCAYRIFAGRNTPAAEANPRIDPALARVLDHAVNKFEENRFPSIAEFRNALAEVAGPDPVEEAVRQGNEALRVGDVASLEKGRATLKGVAETPEGRSQQERIKAVLEEIGVAIDELERKRHLADAEARVNAAIAAGQFEEADRVVKAIQGIDAAHASRLASTVLDARRDGLRTEVIALGQNSPNDKVDLGKLVDSINRIAADPLADQDLKSSAQQAHARLLDHLVRRRIEHAVNLLAVEKPDEADAVLADLSTIPNLTPSHATAMEEVSRKSRETRQLIKARQEEQRRREEQAAQERETRRLLAETTPDVVLTFAREVIAHDLKGFASVESMSLAAEEISWSVDQSRWSGSARVVIRLRAFPDHQGLAPVDLAERDKQVVIRELESSREKIETATRGVLVARQRAVLAQVADPLRSRWFPKLIVRGALEKLSERFSLEVDALGDGARPSVLRMELTWQPSSLSWRLEPDEALVRGCAAAAALSVLREFRIQVTEPVSRRLPPGSQIQPAANPREVNPTTVLPDVLDIECQWTITGPAAELLDPASRQRQFTVQFPSPDFSTATRDLTAVVTSLEQTRTKRRDDQVHRLLDRIKSHPSIRQGGPEPTIHYQPGDRWETFVLRAPRARTRRLRASWDATGLVLSPINDWDRLLERWPGKPVSRRLGVAGGVIAGIGMFAVLLYLIFRPVAPPPELVKRELFEALTHPADSESAISERYVRKAVAVDDVQPDWINVYTEPVGEDEVVVSGVITGFADGQSYRCTVHKTPEITDQFLCQSAPEGGTIALGDLRRRLLDEVANDQRERWAQALTRLNIAFSDLIPGLRPVALDQRTPQPLDTEAAAELAIGWPLTVEPQPLQLTLAGAQRDWQLKQEDRIRKIVSELKQKLFEVLQPKVAKRLYEVKIDGENDLAAFLPDGDVVLELPEPASINWNVGERGWISEPMVHLRCEDCLASPASGAKNAVQLHLIHVDTVWQLVESLSDQFQDDLVRIVSEFQELAKDVPFRHLKTLFPNRKVELTSALPALSATAQVSLDPADESDRARSADLNWDKANRQWTLANKQEFEKSWRDVARSRLENALQHDLSANRAFDSKAQLNTALEDVTETDGEVKSVAFAVTVNPGFDLDRQTRTLLYPDSLNPANHEAADFVAELATAVTNARRRSAFEEIKKQIAEQTANVGCKLEVNTPELSDEPSFSVQLEPAENSKESEIKQPVVIRFQWNPDTFHYDGPAGGLDSYDTLLTQLCPIDLLGIAGNQALWNSVQGRLRKPDWTNHWLADDPQAAQQIVLNPDATGGLTITIPNAWGNLKTQDGLVFGPGVEGAAEIKLDWTLLLPESVRKAGGNANPAEGELDDIADGIRSEVHNQAKPNLWAHSLAFADVQKSGFLLENLTKDDLKSAKRKLDQRFKANSNRAEKLFEQFAGAQEKLSKSVNNFQFKLITSVKRIALEGDGLSVRGTVDVMASPESLAGLGWQLKPDWRKVEPKETAFTLTIPANTNQPPSLVSGEFDFDDFEQLAQWAAVVMSAVADAPRRAQLESEFLEILGGASQKSVGGSELHSYLNRIAEIKLGHNLENASATLEELTRALKGPKDAIGKEKYRTVFVELFEGLSGHYALIWKSKPASGSEAFEIVEPKIVRLNGEAGPLNALLTFLKSELRKTASDGVLGLMLAVDGGLLSRCDDISATDFSGGDLKVELMPEQDPTAQTVDLPNLKKLSDPGFQAGFWCEGYLARDNGEGETVDRGKIGELGEIQRQSIERFREIIVEAH